MFSSRFWTTCLRLPDNLHRMLKQAAEISGWSLKTEIVTRLQNSLRGRP